MELHMAVDDWLTRLELQLYLPNFKEFNGVEDMLHLTERELKDMGIKNSSHRARLATSLTILKKKYEKACNISGLNTSAAAFDNVNSPVSGSVFPAHVCHQKTAVRSWPSSQTSSHTSTEHSSYRSSMTGLASVDASPEDLEKMLQLELQMDKSNLCCYAWYHGTIPRQRAEELVIVDGDFIVRDCISQPGAFVITCRWQNCPLHFIVKKVISHPSTIYEKVQFCFEDEYFDSIPNFITYYVGSKHPLSSNSGVVISHPINRTKPISYYMSLYGAQCQMQYVTKALEKITSLQNEDNHASIGNCNANKTNDRSNMSVVYNAETNSKELISQKKLIRVGSDPEFNSNVKKKILDNRPNSGTICTEAVKEMVSNIMKDNPPPKPSRVPSKRLQCKPIVVKRGRLRTESLSPTGLCDVPQANNHAETENNFDSTIIRPHMRAPYKRIMSGETRFSFLDHPSVSDDGSLSETETVENPFTIPLISPPSCFQPNYFYSPLITENNKPLETKSLTSIKQIILSQTPKQIACHLTYIDMCVVRNLDDDDFGLGVTSGLELILLPQGHQLVCDLLERTQCLKLLVAISILTCATEEERVEVLSRWIQIALETKSTLGNFYSFAGIMLGLIIPQVASLQATWLDLRQYHTEIAFTFETKLRPVLKGIQTNPKAVLSNMSIPYVLSLLIILHHHFEVMQKLSNVTGEIQIEEYNLDFGLSSEHTTQDFGIENLEYHLSENRYTLQRWQLFCDNAKNALTNMNYDELLLDMFRTEFHLRLFWGYKGATVSAVERHKKFKKVLDVLFKRC